MAVGSCLPPRDCEPVAARAAAGAETVAAAAPSVAIVIACRRVVLSSTTFAKPRSIPTNVAICPRRTRRKAGRSEIAMLLIYVKPLFFVRSSKRSFEANVCRVEGQAGNSGYSKPLSGFDFRRT